MHAAVSFQISCDLRDLPDPSSIKDASHGGASGAILKRVVTDALEKTLSLFLVTREADAAARPRYLSSYPAGTHGLNVGTIPMLVSFALRSSRRSDSIL